MKNSPEIVGIKRLIPVLRIAEFIFLATISSIPVALSHCTVIFVSCLVAFSLFIFN